MRLIDADALQDAMTGVCNIFDAQGIDTTISRTLMIIAKKAPTVGGWISMKDRSPEDDGLYIVYGMTDAMRKLLPECVPIWICNWYKKHGGWRDIASNTCCDFITHWMPMPEPPKMDMYEEIGGTDHV
jgi:hypothetical protein